MLKGIFKNLGLYLGAIVAALATVTVMNVAKVKPLEKSLSMATASLHLTVDSLLVERGNVARLASSTLELTGEKDSLVRVVEGKDELAAKLAAQNQTTFKILTRKERAANALADSLASKVPVITKVYEIERSKGIFSKKVLVLKDSTLTWGLALNL